MMHFNNHCTTSVNLLEVRILEQSSLPVPETEQNSRSKTYGSLQFYATDLQSRQ